MKEITISKTDAGQRLDKYLVKLMPHAGRGFIYKMLRKKNIVLNGAKSDGSDKISAGDVVKLFLSDETYHKMSRGGETAAASTAAPKNNYKLCILYEDDNILVVNKPSGLLSQKASPDDISLNEMICEYLKESTRDTAFKSGICNRLDRNTSGIIVAGKTILGSQTMSAAFHDRTIGKYYICVVKGIMQSPARLCGYITKDAEDNTARVITQEEWKSLDDAARAVYVPIDTEFMPVAAGEHVTLVKVHLITGKTHQIRAHLKSIGYPIAGDYKYGDDTFNKVMKEKYRIKSQMLHACELVIPAAVYRLKDVRNLHTADKKILSSIKDSKNQVIRTPIPDEFITVLKGENIWRLGIQEDLEALH